MPPAFFIHPRQAGPVLEPDNDSQDFWNWRKHAKDEDLILESWSQGFVVGALGLMACITIANMRRRVLLHKLILVEQLFALSHGSFCFMNFEGYGWYLSSTAALLYLSYILHNVVAWMKIKPFFEGKSTIFSAKFVRWTTPIYISTLCLTVPVILFQITDNFRYFNGYGGWYVAVRPYEPLMRDPWWVFCSAIFCFVLARSYGMKITMIIKRSPRFGILFASLILALIFTGFDVAASIHPFIGDTDGINPFWKLSLVFKCLTDAILLDDFKTELKRLGVKRIKKDERRRASFALTLSDDHTHDSDEEAAMHYSNGTIDTTDVRTNSFALHPSSSPHNRKKNSDVGDSEQVEFMSALHTFPSQLSSDRESRRPSMQRAQIGQGGTPATKLPRLFAAIKPGRKAKKPTAEPARNDSIGTSDTEDLQPEMQESKSKSKAKTITAGSDEIVWEDDSLQRAKEEQARTIEELKQRQENSATRMSAASPHSADRLRQQRRQNLRRDSWDELNELDEEEDEGPSSSSQGSSSKIS
ncbi:hypothetical protein LTS08_005765 [Lithohypha guttulata]|nr:hypothetical protein LTS08_005765 [Lithohypha guttulata]